jgi:hypothetical protein
VAMAGAERACCGHCGRALTPCEWCGLAGLLIRGLLAYPVTRAPGWPGPYHEPCRDAEAAALARTRHAPAWTPPRPPRRRRGRHSYAGRQA